MQSRTGVKKPYLCIGTPFDAHLGCHVYKINLRMEYLVRICRQLIKIFKYRKILRGKRISACAEQVKSFAVSEEDSLLGLVYYKLRVQIKILNRMLPYKNIVSALVFYYAGKALIFYFFLFNPLLHVYNGVT